MAATKQQIIDMAVKGLDQIDPSKTSSKALVEMLDALDDEGFNNWMKSLEDGEDFVPVLAPPLNHKSITTENNLKVAKAWGVELYQQLRYTEPTTGMVIITPQKYLLLECPVRRQIQTLESKSSIPNDTKVINETTGQAAGESKSSAITLPETMVMYGNGYDKVLEELLKFRGGDQKGMRLMDQSLYNTGGVSLDGLKHFDTKVASTQTLAVYLKSAHLNNNIAE